MREKPQSTSNHLLPKIFDSVDHFHNCMLYFFFVIFAKVHRKKHSKEESRTRNGWSMARNIRSQNHPRSRSRVDAFKKKASYRSFGNIYTTIWEAGISHSVRTLWFSFSVCLSSSLHCVNNHISVIQHTS